MDLRIARGNLFTGAGLSAAVPDPAQAAARPASLSECEPLLASDDPLSPPALTTIVDAVRQAQPAQLTGFIARLTGEVAARAAYDAPPSSAEPLDAATVVAAAHSRQLQALLQLVEAHYRHASGAATDEPPSIAQLENRLSFRSVQATVALAYQGYERARIDQRNAAGSEPANAQHVGHYARAVQEAGGALDRSIISLHRDSLERAIGQTQDDLHHFLHDGHSPPPPNSFTSILGHMERYLSALSLAALLLAAYPDASVEAHAAPPWPAFPRLEEHVQQSDARWAFCRARTEMRPLLEAVAATRKLALQGQPIPGCADQRLAVQGIERLRGAIGPVLESSGWVQGAYTEILRTVAQAVLDDRADRLETAHATGRLPPPHTDTMMLLIEMHAALEQADAGLPLAQSDLSDLVSMFELTRDRGHPFLQWHGQAEGVRPLIDFSPARERASSPSSALARLASHAARYVQRGDETTEQRRERLVRDVLGDGAEERFFVDAAPMPTA